MHELTHTYLPQLLSRHRTLMVKANIYRLDFLKHIHNSPDATLNIFRPFFSFNAAFLGSIRRYFPLRGERSLFSCVVVLFPNLKPLSDNGTAFSIVCLNTHQLRCLISDPLRVWFRLLRKKATNIRFPKLYCFLCFMYRLSTSELINFVLNSRSSSSVVNASQQKLIV